MTRSILIAIDAELDGPTPMQHSMRSLSAVAFTDHHLFATPFYVRLTPQIGAQTHPDQMKFWEAHPEAWNECLRDPISPEEGMNLFSQWLAWFQEQPDCNITFVAQPASVDFMFLKCYYERYGPVEKTPLPYYCQDFVAMRFMYRLLTQTSKTKLAELLSVHNPRPHHADADALQLAHMCGKLRRLVKRIAHRKV